MKIDERIREHDLYGGIREMRIAKKLNKVPQLN
jgi:hypothetical protein